MPRLPRSSFAIFALAALALAACAEEHPAVAPARPLIPTAPPRPAPTTTTADFRAVFAADARSRSVYTQVRDPDWGARILLGPNAVFESSRSTLSDAQVAGPEGGASPAPDQHDALGAPIDMALSNRLLNYLVGKGSVVLAPAVTRRWSAEWWCPRESCASMSWVERALLAPRVKPAAAKDAPRVDVRADELPTATLAVRRLGRATIHAEVVVQADGASLIYRFRRSLADESLCPPVSFDVPVLVFEAEIVSVRDGRILARIEEARQIVIPSQAVAEIEASVPVENPEAVTLLRQAAEAANQGRWNGAVPAVPYWLRSDVRCKNGEEALRRLAQHVTSQAEAEQEATAGQMLAKALDPMFAGRVGDEGKAGKGRAKGK